MHVHIGGGGCQTQNKCKNCQRKGDVLDLFVITDFFIILIKVIKQHGALNVEGV